jgi:hypothetical protein
MFTDKNTCNLLRSYSALQKYCEHRNTFERERLPMKVLRLLSLFLKRTIFSTALEAPDRPHWQQA